MKRIFLIKLNSDQSYLLSRAIDICIDTLNEDLNNVKPEELGEDYLKFVSVTKRSLLLLNFIDNKILNYRATSNLIFNVLKLCGKSDLVLFSFLLLIFTQLLYIFVSIYKLIL